MPNIWGGLSETIHSESEDSRPKLRCCLQRRGGTRSATVGGTAYDSLFRVATARRALQSEVVEARARFVSRAFVESRLLFMRDSRDVRPL